MIRPALLTCLLALQLPAAVQPERVDLRLDRTPLHSLLYRISRQCEAGLAIHHEVQDRVMQPATLTVDDAPWADAVALIRSRFGLALRLDGERLHVRDADSDLRSRLVVRRYDIGPLIAPLASRPARDLGIPEPGGTGSRLLMAIAAPPEPLDLESIVAAAVGSGSGPASGVRIEERGRELVVVHVPEAQAEVERLLAGLEAPLSRQIAVRAWRLAQPPEGAGAVLDAPAARALIAAAGPPALAWVGASGELNHGCSGMQRAIIADSDIVQEIDDPIISIVGDGLSIDVLPQRTRNGILARIRLWAVDARPARAAEIGDGGGRPLIAVDQPAQRMDVAQEDRLVPDGGAALFRLGGRCYLVQLESTGR